MKLQARPSWLQKLWRSEVLLPLAVALVLRILAAPLAHLAKPQFWEYGDIARNLLNGRGYAFDWYYMGNGITLHFPSAFMPPGQGFIVWAGLRLLGDSFPGYVAVFIEELILNLGFVYATSRVVGTLFSDRRLVRLAAWMAAIYPSFIVATASFGVISAVLLLDAVFVWAILTLTDNMRKGRSLVRPAIATGISGGLLTLFRSESFFVLGITFVLVGWLNRDLVGIYWKKISLVFLALAFVAAPWIIRNYVQFHRVIVGSTSGAFNFWRGHNPNATGSSWNEFDQPIWTTDTMWAEMEPGPHIDSNVEFVNGAYHLRKAKEWMAGHPGVEVERTFRKFVLFWGIDWYSKSARTWPYILTYAATIALLVLGGLRVRREQKSRSTKTGLDYGTRRDGIAIIALWCVLYTIVTMIFFSLPRLQIILIGVYFPIVVYGADDLLRRIRKARRRREYRELRAPFRRLATKQKVFVN